jgi:TrmH family RNA methyltransferase
VSLSPSVVTSTANPRVKAAARLRDRRTREATGLTIVEGGRELLRALAAGVRVREAFVCRDLVRSEDAETAIEHLRAARADVIEVGPTAFAKLAFGARTEGVLATVRVPSVEIADLDLPPEPLILVAEGIEKPGNLGAVFRSADGAGADAVVAASPRTDLFNPNAIRASLGTIFAVPFGSAPAAKVLAWLRLHEMRIVAARPGAALLATDADLRGRVAIVVGAEAEGLGDAWNEPDIEAVRLPMLGVADSLNVAASSAVLLYEARRQRGVPPKGGDGPR